MLLNLGSGGRKLPGHVNVDWQPLAEPDVVCNLANDPWPFEDNSADGGAASHVLEHIGPTHDNFFHFMKEWYRVSKNGAIYLILLPHPRHRVYLDDPTHVRPVSPKMLALFSKKFVEEQAEQGAMYTPFYKYLGVDFEVLQPIIYNPDAAWVGRPDILEAAEKYNNVIVEVQFKVKVIK